MARRLAQGGEEGLDEAQTTEVVDFEALLRPVSGSRRGRGSGGGEDAGRGETRARGLTLTPTHSLTPSLVHRHQFGRVYASDAGVAHNGHQGQGHRCTRGQVLLHVGVERVERASLGNIDQDLGGKTWAEELAGGRFQQHEATAV